MTRAELAAQQAALLRALLADGEPPPGFPPETLQVEATALRAKRSRVVARLRPDLRVQLGDRYPELFARYARAHPKRGDQRARDDATAFADWLVACGQLPPPPASRRRFPWPRRSAPARLRRGGSLADKIRRQVASENGFR